MEWDDIMKSMFEESQSKMLIKTAYKTIKVGDKLISIRLSIDDMKTPDIELNEIKYLK